ncbi:MAG TPA: acyl-CoA synthetase [Candidatus Dormibacteraeota bacterium]|nr:acyl-CoA synthetase [Candidatus Dormibacteraeota bacterium]
MPTLPSWTWRIPAEFNAAAACTDAHLGTAAATRPAVICEDHLAGVRQLSFAELATRTSQLAQLLRELDVAAGDRVLVRLPNCLEYPIVFLGAMKRGAVPVPTSILLTADEVLFLARDAGAVALATTRESWNALHDDLERIDGLRHVLLVGAGDTAPATRLQLHDLDAALAAISRWKAPHPTRADDPAYLVYTSGTTGYAKGALHAHRSLLGRQPASEYWFSFAPEGGDRVLHSGKYNWTYVLGTGLTDPLYRGTTTIVYEGPPSPHVWPRLIADHGATIFIGVPTLYRQILQKTDRGSADVPTLRHCMSAGEPLSGEVLAAWRSRFGQDIYEGLGMTECSYYISQPRAYPVRPGSAGFPQPGHDVRLLDPRTMQPVPVGAEGMLCIPRRDPALLLRYWNRDAETAEAFHGDWFLTGDYARLDADGYLWFLGRRDDLINTFGYRVSPYEVERVIKDHPEVADCAAVAEEPEPGKVVVAAYVIPRPGGRLTPEAVRVYASQHLASYKAPRLVYLVDDLPRTRNGKVLRRALRPPPA